MPLTSHQTQLAIALSLPEVSLESLHSLSLMSRATAAATRRDFFHTLKTLHTSDLFREGTFVHSLLLPETGCSSPISRLVR